MGSKQILRAVIVITLAILMASCRGSGCMITEQDILHDTVFCLRLERDSVIMHDSTFIREYVKGDTVHVDRDRWHTKYRERAVHDSIYIHKTDTITKTRTVEVRKPLRWYQSFFQCLGVASVFVFIGIVLYLFAKKFP